MLCFSRTVSPKSGILTLLLAVLIIAACNKESDHVPDPGGTDSYVLGWAGMEDAAGTPDDILPFSGTLPSWVDLTPWLGPIFDQGQYGTCVACGSGYNLFSCLNAIQHNLSKSDLLNQANLFSPKDLYLAITNKAPNCGGTWIKDAMEVMQARGIAPLSVAPYQNLGDCSAAPDPSWAQYAAQHKIESFREVPLDEVAIKDKLAHNLPLAFGAVITESFVWWKGAAPMKREQIINSTKKGGHAMAIVGYDDSKHAFRIVNSWGTAWADGGFAWVDYDLMTSPQFTQYIAVAYPKAPNPNNPVQPVNHQDYNLTVPGCWDQAANNPVTPQNRKTLFDVWNSGQNNVSSTQKWSAIYLYYNAFNANEYGVLLHEYITDEFGWPNTNGYYAGGQGLSSSWWFNVELPPAGSLGYAMFGSSNGISWEYTMPPVTGSYYLVMIADPFDAVPEADESDNYYFITNAQGGPIWFQNGVGQGIQGKNEDRADTDISKRTPVNASNLNAYTPNEIIQFIRHEKETGALRAKVEALGRTTGTMPSPQ